MRWLGWAARLNAATAAMAALAYVLIAPGLIAHAAAVADSPPTDGPLRLAHGGHDNATLVRDSRASSIGRCALKKTVIATVASGVYIPSAVELAMSAADVGYKCIVSQPYDKAHAAALASAAAAKQGPRISKSHPLIHVLPVPKKPLLPERMFCDTVNKKGYGWRRTHLHKMLMFRRVLGAGFDLLSLDANYLLAKDPLPLLHSIRSPSSKGPSDVVAMHDGPMSKLLNIGVIWIRSTELTYSLSWRAENRTRGGWDQYVFNEELNFNPAYQQISCCYTNCLRMCLNTQQDAVNKSTQGLRIRQNVEGKDRCADTANEITLPPPQGSLFYGGSKRPWNQTGYNYHVKAIATPDTKREFGRCTRMSMKCLGISSTTCTPERASGSRHKHSAASSSGLRALAQI
mmetsp:Transcript_29191/g.61378  ORF Transcript_29191/g.61378 Transcript_29191/m.61378 type:complete len:402 (+) Transcript_29191:1-1206(+)